MSPWRWLHRLLRHRGLKQCRRGHHAVRALAFIPDGRAHWSFMAAIMETWHRTSCPRCGRAGWAFAMEPGWLEIVSLAPGKYRIEKRHMEGR